MSISDCLFGMNRARQRVDTTTSGFDWFKIPQLIAEVLKLSILLAVLNVENLWCKTVPVAPSYLISVGVRIQPFVAVVAARVD